MQAITIRKLTSKDIEYFYSWASDPDVTKSLTWEAYKTKDEAERFLRGVVEIHPSFNAICADGIPVGSLTLSFSKANPKNAEIGYVLGKEHWGKRIASHAVKQALDLGFSNFDIEVIEGFVDPENIASQKVLINAGMICEGLLKNHVNFKGTLRDRLKYSIKKESTS